MEKMALNVDTEIYMTLGLYGSNSKVVSEAPPRALLLLSSFLEKSIQRNEKPDEASRNKDVITIFHGQRAPKLSIRQYLERVFKYANCSTSCFVLAYMYLLKFLKKTGSCLTTLNVHRLIITTVMVAAKYVDDVCLNNAYYAKVGGVSTAEMNRLEMNLLFNLDFRLHVTVETFWMNCLQLENEDLQVEVCSWKDETRCSAKKSAVAGYSCRAM